MERTEREKNLIAGRREEHGPVVLYWEPTFVYKEGGNQISRKCFTVDDSKTNKRYRYDSFDEAAACVELLSRPHHVLIAMQAMGLVAPFDKAALAEEKK